LPDLALSAAWQSCLAAWLQAVYGRSGSERSRIVYRNQILRFLAEVGKSPEQVTRSDVRAFIGQSSQGNRHRGEPVSPSTQNGRLTALASFYRFASTFDIDGQPLFTGQLPTVGFPYLAPDITYRAMSASELQRFFAVIPHDTIIGLRDRALFLCYFWTARRRSEIASLTYGDIEPATFPDGHQGYIYRYHGKGKSRQIKTKELPLPAWEAIDRYLVASGRKATIKATDPLFVALYQKSGHALTSNWLNMRFKRYAEQAGLDTERLSLHSLRHTASRERRQSGQDILEIKELLDHANLSTTWLYLQRYAGETDTGAHLLEHKFRRL